MKYHIQKAHLQQIYKSRPLYCTFTPMRSEQEPSSLWLSLWRWGTCLSVCVILPFRLPPHVVSPTSVMSSHQAPSVFSRLLHELHCRSGSSCLLAVLSEHSATSQTFPYVLPGKSSKFTTLLRSGHFWDCRPSMAFPPEQGCPYSLACV